jgi:hypothetical protein
MRAHPRTVIVLVAAAALTLAPGRPAHAADDGVWTALDPGAATPIARRECAAIYDDVDNRMVMFGGFGDNVSYPGWTLYNDTWQVTLGGAPQWSLLAPANDGPGRRASPQWGYDPARRRFIMFGGYGYHYPNSLYQEYLNDVWELSLRSPNPHWIELHPVGDPPLGRLAGSAVYDPLNQRFVGFGGTRGLPVDTWTLELKTAPKWNIINTTGTRPVGSYGMYAIYDPVRNRMITFGGSTSDEYHGVNNNTWELSLDGTPSWTQLAPSGTLPSARRSGMAIYDPLRDRMVIFGGWDSGPDATAFLNDTWAMDLSSDPPVWGQLAPGGTTPIRRDVASTVYDPTHDRMVMFGGWEATYMLHDTQFLSWGGTGSPTSTVANGAGTPTAAQVSWNVQDATAAYTGVYRKDATNDWTSVAALVTDAGGNVAFTDPGVVPGQQYGYQLVVSGERGTTAGGEVWVTIPTTTGIDPGASAFALRRIAPNPVIDRLSVTFSLSSTGPATVELLDISGRRVLAREVGSMGVGIHNVDLSIGRQNAPGVYFLRLMQGNQAQTRRVVVEGGGE